jgi:hypothetical protein
MSRCGHRRQPSIIPENTAILEFEEEIMVGGTITARKKRSPIEDTPYVSNEIKHQSSKELSADKKVSNKNILVDGKGMNDKEGVTDLASQVKTSLTIKDI